MERNLERLVKIAASLFRNRPVKVIVELGARDCRETLGFRASFPQACIVTFECNPRTLPQCREAIAGMREATLIEKAVSDHAGTVRFHPVETARSAAGEAHANPGASSLFRADYRFALERYEQSSIWVEAITLAEVMSTHQLPGIDLLWMDIQGAELLALKGLGERLAEVKLIHCEVEFVPVYSGQPLFPEIARFLKSRGFAFVGFTIYAKHSGDAVFVNLRHFSRLAIARAVWQNRLLLWKRLQWMRHRAKRSLLGRV